MEVPEEITLALKLARQTARGNGKIAIFAMEMVRILERGVKRIEVAELPTLGSHVAKAGEELVVYMVDQDRGHGESLAEHRTSGKSKPFRCPKEVYDAVVGVLAAADRPLALEEIMVATEKVLGHRPADYQVRVAIRLWMQVDSRLVRRNRARYSTTAAPDFVVSANTLWEALRQ